MKINKKAVSHFLGLAVLFGVIELTHQLTKTEEQVTYSVTLEDLAHGQSETNGEAGGTGGGADGETGGTTGGTTGGGTGNNVRTYYEDYYNKTEIVTRRIVRISSSGIEYTEEERGKITYCKSRRRKKCYPELNGWIPFD